MIFESTQNTETGGGVAWACKLFKSYITPTI